MVRYLLAFLAVILITVKLSAELIPLSSNTVNVIKSNNDYTLEEAGATYTVTSNGSPVNARLIITASAKLILDNCHILRTSAFSPITIDASGVTLEIQIKNTNTICTNYNDNGATSAIASDYTYAPTLIFSEAPNAPASSELLLRGSSAENSSTAPVHLNKKGTNKSGSIIFRSGTVRIATSEGKNSTYSSWIPYLATANSITFSGGTIVAQICPRDGLGISYSKLSETENFVRSFFNCNSFTMTGGLLTTRGEPCSENSHILKCKNEPYDTYFSYAPTFMDRIVPVTTTPSIIGGMKCTTNTLSCYGLQPNTTYPAGGFTHTGTAPLKDQTTNNDGILSITNANLYPDLAFKYLDATSEALVKVFNATPRPTVNGCTAEAQFGISHITIDAESLHPILHLTLNLINDPSTVEEKTVYVRIFCEVDAEERVMIADQPFVFTRDSSGAPIFTATFTDTTQARAASRTVRYTIEAYN